MKEANVHAVFTFVNVIAIFNFWAWLVNVSESYRAKEQAWLK